MDDDLYTEHLLDGIDEMEEELNRLREVERLAKVATRIFYEWAVSQNVTTTEMEAHMKALKAAIDKGKVKDEL